MEFDDTRLVSRARAGSSTAYGELLVRHEARLRQVCGEVLADRTAAADVAQEAAVVGWLQLDRLRDPGRFGAWLVAIGRNLALQALRDGARRREWLAADVSPVDGFSREAEDPAQLVLAREQAAELAAAISALPPGQRDAVVLFHLAGLPQDAVARRLQTGAGAVRTRLHKARKTLRAHLEPDHPTREDEMPSTAIPATVTDVRRTPAGRHVVLLTTEQRDVPIWVGRPEAEALAACLQDVEFPRPSTHALALSLVTVFGRSIDRVRVTRLHNDTFYAELVMDDGTIVDARPSDAFVLALSAGADLEVTRDVLDATAAGPPDEYVDDLAALPVITSATIAGEVRHRIETLGHRSKPER